MDERKRLNKNGMGRRERKEAEKAEKRLEKKVLREERRFDRLAVGGEKEREQMEGLYRRYADLQWDMASFTEGHEMWLAMKDPDTRTKAQRIQSQIFQQRAVFECFDQLRGGLSANNVIACVGMYVGLSLVNPEIRKTGQKMYAQALDGAVRYMENNPDKSMLGMRGLMMDNFAKKRDKYMRSANDGRMPFTAETAALASIRLDMECYRMMRDGEHAPDDVMAEHVKAVKTLEDVCAFDGVDMGDMARSKRIIVAKMMGDKSDPERAKALERMYEQFDTTGGWQKAEARTERVLGRDASGDVRMMDRKVWTGEYQTVADDGYTPVNVADDAPLTVRGPYSKGDVAKHVANIMVDYGASYSMDDIADGYLRRHVAQLGREDIGEMFGNGSYRCDRRSMIENEGASEEALGAMSDYFKDVCERAKHDWAADMSGDEMHDEMMASLHLGILRGTVSTTLSSSFEQYADLCRKHGIDDERLLTRRSVEMSVMAAEYVKMCGGTSPEDEDFQKGASSVAAQYALLCVADSLGIEMSPGVDGMKAAEKVGDAIQNDPRAHSMAVRVASEMSYMMNSYGYAYEGALFHGNTPEEADAAMVAGFSATEIAHDHEFDHQFEGGPSSEKARYRVEERRAVALNASNWAVDAMKHMSLSDELSYALNRMKSKRYEAEADARADHVENRLGNYLQSGDGPEYE